MNSVIARLAVGVLLSISTSAALAQNAHPSAWDSSENPQVHMIAAAAEPEQDLYLLSPGHYVYPPTGRADYWSPHIRPFPDYSGLRRPRNINPLPRNRLGGAWGTSRSFGGSYFWGPAVANAPCYGNGYGSVADAYNQGRYDADHEYLWFIASQRAGRLINQSAEMFDEGILLFRDGHYEKAAIKWIGAGDTNQGNAAAKLHAGHAMFALGRYADGIDMLARAFELSPTLAYKSYDIRDEYGDQSDFDLHLANLKTRVVRRPTDPDAMAMLGYVLFYTDGPEAALPVLERAARLDPDSYFIPKLQTLARQASPAPDMRVSTPREELRPSREYRSRNRRDDADQRTTPRNHDRSSSKVKFVRR